MIICKKFPLNFLYNQWTKDILTSLVFFSFAVCLAYGAYTFIHTQENTRWFRWDFQWYNSIMTNGYATEYQVWTSKGTTNWAFFPLVPLCAKILIGLTGCSSKIALVSISSFFFLLSILIFIRLTRLIFPNIPSFIPAGIVALSPLSIYAFLGYKESTFFFLSCLTTYFFIQKHYLKAGISGCFLTSSSIFGLFLLPALALGQIKQFFKNTWKEKLSYILSLSLMPLGFAFFVIYLYIHVGDGLAFLHIQKVWDLQQSPFNPFYILYQGFQRNDYRFYFSILGIICLIVSCYFFLIKQYTLGLFLSISTIIALSVRLLSFLRYGFWLFPLLMFLSKISNYKKLYRIVFPIFIVLLLITYWAWMKGKIWTV